MSWTVLARVLGRAGNLLGSPPYERNTWERVMLGRLSSVCDALRSHQATPEQLRIELESAVALGLAALHELEEQGAIPRRVSADVLSSVERMD